MTFRSTLGPFRTKLGEEIFAFKYRHDGCETWDRLANTLVTDVFNTAGLGDKFKAEQEYIYEIIRDMKFIPGGRYLYYAGRPTKFFNNCYLLRAEEDTREDWAELSWKSERCLMVGGGIGIDYSVYRPSGALLKKTGGFASGPLPKMIMINEIGRHVMQGGSRRSAIYASLNWKHDDIPFFLKVKDWSKYRVGNTEYTIADIKQQDFDFWAPLDMTNISVNYDTEWLLNYWKTGDVGDVFMENVRCALMNGEPGFSFNFFDKENETLRNACTEITSEDDSDVCNLGSINLSRINSLDEMKHVVEAATLFLLVGTLAADLPYEKVYRVREKNRRLGLGIMGIHEWLLKHGKKYDIDSDLERLLEIYARVSRDAAKNYSEMLGISTPVATRAIAPTGSIGLLAGTTTGIEPVFAVAYKRRYRKNNKWHYQYAVDDISFHLINEFGIKPEDIETSYDLAVDPERRIRFQAWIQRYVDQGISSTINLPAWGTKHNNEDFVKMFANILAKYAKDLRGFTCYPDGARGGQPIVPVSYDEAVTKIGIEYVEDSREYHDVCDLTKGGICGS